jgi:Flp pilus assembly protein TadG
MRRLTTHDRDDRGGATVFIIIALTSVLIGVGFAIDVGQYVVAARSAQNTADATALAVATDCALTGAPNADYSPYRKPGQTISAPACGSGEATITAAKDVDGLFLQQSAGAVDRTATARWGTLAAANVLPIVIASCEFSQALLDGSSDTIFYLDDPKPQSGCSSLPGGFSQLAGDGCAVEVSAGGTAPGQPGGALQKVVPCITNPNSPALPHTVLIPIYDADACEAAGCKGKGPYPILGFAAFKVTGYSFNGNNYAGTLDKKCPDDKDRGRYCLRGDFIKFTTTQGTPGPSTNFGATQVYLYS